MIKIEKVNFEDIEAVKKYFSRIFTVLPKEIREKLMNLDITETTLEKLKKELAFLSEDKQNEYLNEIHKIYNEIFNDYGGINNRRLKIERKRKK